MNTDPKDLMNAVSLGKPLGVVSSSLIRAGMDFWTRSMDIGARHFARAVSTAVAPGMDTTGSDNTVDALIEVYRQYLVEMVSAPGAAMHQFRQSLSESDGDKLLLEAKRFNTGDLHHLDNRQVLAEHGIVLPAGTTIREVSRGKRWIIEEPRPGRRFTLVKRKQILPQGTGDCYCLYGRQDGDRYTVKGTRVRLPARVQDASQGFAVYRVARDVVQELLDVDPIIKATGIPFRAWDIGGEETPIALFMVDYRQSDLGSYREFGIACFVAPQKDPLAMGMHLLGLYVDSILSKEAGNQIWGYPKRLLDGIEMHYEAKAVTCILRNGGDVDPIVALKVPRGGSGTSKDIPLTSYTLRNGICKDELIRTVFTRNGSGEMARSQPKGVELTYDQASEHHVVQTLQSLGLVSSDVQADQTEPVQPMLCAWTEHMSGEFGIPALARLQVAEDD